MNNNTNLTLITGGARSGKSTLAEALAESSGHKVYYLATMQHWGSDEEVDDRVRRHRARRPQHWHTLEVPFGLDEALMELPAGPGLAILDCLSVYVANLLLAGYQESENPYLRESVILASVEKLLRTIEARSDWHIVAVTNEVGWGVVPDTPLGRAYRDFLGMANQSFATCAATVWLMCSGLKLQLK